MVETLCVKPSLREENGVWGRKRYRFRCRRQDVLNACRHILACMSEESNFSSNLKFKVHRVYLSKWENKIYFKHTHKHTFIILT